MSKHIKTFYSVDLGIRSLDISRLLDDSSSNNLDSIVSSSVSSAHFHV